MTIHERAAVVRAAYAAQEELGEVSYAGLIELIDSGRVRPPHEISEERFAAMVVATLAEEAEEEAE